MCMLSMKEMNIGCIRSMNDVVCWFIRVTGCTSFMKKPGVLLGVLIVDVMNGLPDSA